MTASDGHAHGIVPELLRDAVPGEAWRPSRGLTGVLLCPWPVATVRAAGLDEDAPAAVLHGNAERELRRVHIAGGHRG